ncbi:MAG: WYL domain-containing protein [Flavobacteriaceae bacterium]|jgi:hypothetical protein|nr:WYL domain-containing protein [Flavobacteriaceae bacterium]
MKELLRIYIVLDLFERRERWTKDEILQAISREETTEVSYETWNRLRKKMGNDYGFNVKYQKGLECYIMEYGDKVDRYKLMNMINHFKTMTLMQEYIEEDKEMVDHLEFEQGMSPGKEVIIDALHNAILKNETVFIMHQGYYSEVPKEVVVNPLYFKQYQNRWYLIVEVSDTKEFKSFGMDRIKEVKYKGATFKSRIKEAKKRFSEVVGVDLQGNGLQDIVIAFAPSQKPYLETLKLHHSQTVVEDTEEKYIIKIRVNPNYELQQQIQKFGSFAEVVEGDWVCL